MKPDGHYDFYNLISTLNLLNKNEIEGTHLFDFLAILIDILKLNDDTESSL